MRRFLASIIVIFSRFITCLLNPFRRASALAIACEGLYDHAFFLIKPTDLKFHATSRRGLNIEKDFGTDETDTINWIEEMTENSCFWDIGANIGIFSLHAAANKNSTVFAFEPASGSFNVLNTNIHLNNISNKVTAYCMAFSGETKIDVLNIENIHPGNSMQEFGTNINQFDEVIFTTFSQGTIGFSIDDFVKIFSPKLPTYIKIDVDGLEREIIRGGRNLLSNSSIESVIIEIEGNLESDRNKEIIQLMIELGFTARSKESDVFRNMIFDK